MLKIAAYGLIFLGIPLVISELFHSLMYLIFLYLFGKEKISIFESFLEMVNGFIAILISILIFKIFKVQLTIYIPIILSVVSLIWFSARKETGKAFLGIIGILIGWFTL